KPACLCGPPERRSLRGKRRSSHFIAKAQPAAAPAQTQEMAFKKRWNSHVPSNGMDGHRLSWGSRTGTPEEIGLEEQNRWRACCFPTRRRQDALATHLRDSKDSFSPGFIPSPLRPLALPTKLHALIGRCGRGNG